MDPAGRQADSARKFQDHVANSVHPMPAAADGEKGIHNHPSNYGASQPDQITATETTAWSEPDIKQTLREANLRHIDRYGLVAGRRHPAFTLTLVTTGDSRFSRYASAASLGAELCPAGMASVLMITTGLPWESRPPRNSSPRKASSSCSCTHTNHIHMHFCPHPLKFPPQDS